jgi:hypothetical protein
MVRLEEVLWRSSRSCLSELPSARTAALVLLYTSSSGSSATTYGLTKLLLHWHDNRQRLSTVSVALYAVLQALKWDSLTVARMYINVYKVYHTVCHRYDSIWLLYRIVD